MSRGRPPYVPTDEDRRKVALLAGMGNTHDEIALLFVNPQTGKSIDPKTLRRCFKHELAVGALQANNQVAGSLFKKATGTGPQSVTAAIFWLKVRARWQTVERTELTGADGDAIEFADVSDAKAELLRRLTPRAAGSAADRADRGAD